MRARCESAATAPLVALVALALALGTTLGGAGTARADAAGPREHYLLHCSGCHGADGRGVPGVTPTLHGLARLLEIPGGREYLASVPGVAQAPLSDRDLAALLNWILREFSPFSPLQPYRASELRALRAVPLRDPIGTRAGLD